MAESSDFIHGIPFPGIFSSLIRVASGPPVTRHYFDAGERSTIKIELPGADKSDVTISVQNGTRLVVTDTSPPGLRTSVVYLQKEDDIDSIKATLKNGLLEINISRLPESEVTIPVSDG